MPLKPKVVDFKQTWSTLQQSIEKVVTQQKIDRSVWDDSFSDIYALCVALPEPLSESLYTKTKEFFEHHVQRLYEEVTKCEEEEVLVSFYDKWQVYSKGTKLVHNLYRYLNDHFIKKHKFTEADLCYGGLPVDQVRSTMLEIGELALDIWKCKMIEPLESILIRLLLEAIQRDRNGEPVNQSVAYGVVQSLVEVEEYKTKSSLDLYENTFEKKFLEASAQHYQKEAGQLLLDCNCSQYMEKVLVRFEEEDLRSRKFLHPSSYEKVRKILEKVMVGDYVDRLRSITKETIQDEKRQDMANMYKLLKSIPEGLKVVNKEFEEYIRKCGLDKVRMLNGDNIQNQFVESVLDVYNKFSEMVRTLFQNDQEFWAALDRACVATINYKDDNTKAPKASEWLARYTDYLLRKSAKGMSESEIEEKLAYAIVIFRYIEDKDMFQKFYSRMLATRLIHGVSVSMDAEECMINKLKQACGYEFTSKLHRMFQDMGVSKTLSEQFHQHIVADNTELEQGFQIQVLQAGAWPLSTQNPGTRFSLPPELQPCVQKFEEFYNKNFSGRKLTWLYSFASADVKINYLPRSYTITMQLYQLAVLLHFNVQSSVNLMDLETSTQLDQDGLIRTVKSLIEAGILKCTDEDIALSSVVDLNLDFTNKRTKFRIGAPVMHKQVEKESEQVNTTVQQDRKYFLECTIVRIMKARKVLKHNQLIQEVISQSRSRFTPEISFIKKIVEQLIEKQYLQRTENADEYAYLA